MAHTTRPLWPSLLFLWTWWALTEYSPFGHHAFFVALLLFWMGWLTIRLFGSATSRLGFRGWLLIVQLAVWYGLFLFVVPLNPVTKILVLWGLATPLLFVGAIWRRVYEGFPAIQSKLDNVPLALLAIELVGIALFAWMHGSRLPIALAMAFMSTTLSGIPFYYGWRLAEPLQRREHDARFGTEANYRTAGWSDER